jgi:hypothetical protein
VKRIERLTNFITPVGMCVTSHNTMEHYHPCIVCRNKAPITTDKSEKFPFCDMCVMKEMFERLKGYEDIDEQGLLLRLPCKVGDTVYFISKQYSKCTAYGERFDDSYCCGCEEECDSKEEYYIAEMIVGYLGWIVDKIDFFNQMWFLTKSEAEQALEKINKENI